jgi:hypothetical protein
MSANEADSSVEYEMCTGTDGDRQLVAVDPDARWTVFEQWGDGPLQRLDQSEAEGEVAYYQKVLGNPSWYIKRGPGWRHYVEVEGRSDLIDINDPNDESTR